MVARLVREADPALGTEPLAVLPANRLERQHGHYCVPQDRLKIDGIVPDSTLLFIVFPFQGLGTLVGEKLLHIDVEAILDGIQAPPALAGYIDVRGSRYQDPLVDSFEPQVEVHGGPFPDADERHTEVSRCWHMLFECPHRTRTPPEVLDVKRQGRTIFALNENSCRT